MNQFPEKFDAITVTLNPAIDRTLRISNFTPDSVNRVEGERSQPGGKGVNVACALANHGLKVAVTGFLGRDNPELFVELFAKKQIADRFVRIQGETRTGIKITDPVRGQTTDINFPGVKPSSTDIESLDGQLASLNAKWVVLAGSLPPGVDPAIFARLIRTLKQRGMRVALDTSGEGLRQGIQAQPDLIKPNIHELEALLGQELTDLKAVVRAAGVLNSQGIELVVISMGKSGAVFARADEVIAVRPPEMEVGSTVGAGDAMVAGIIAGHHLPLEECARLATGFSLNLLTGGRTPAAIVERLSPLL